MSKSRDVQVSYITEHTRVFRSRTWDRLKFEIEYGLEKGTTANSFLIESDKTILINPPGESFTEIFLQALQDRIDPQSIDYLILSHVNLNRCTTIKSLLNIAPQLTLICSNPGAITLQNTLTDLPLNLKIIKTEENLNIGQGHDLEFIPTPIPRWPDELCIYDPKTQILYTDKLFGAHVCGDQVLDEGWTIYQEDRRYYFDCVMAPSARQVITALNKLSTKEAKIYATGHGPLVRYGLKELTRAYLEWSENQQKQELSVALIYASAYGNTATLAQAIALGITKAGVRVESLNAEIASPEDIKTAVTQAEGFIFGSPTLGGHPPTQIQTALGITLATASKNKLTGVFGSYGWSGEAIDILEGKLRDGGYRFGIDTIRVKFKPTEVVLKSCEEAGTDFAQALKKQLKASKPKPSVNASLADRTQQALGRVVGSLCVVTTVNGEVKGGMLASWVSQATFNPPGLTIAVAKERAIESLLYSGSVFVLNVLEQGKHLGLMKHFLKPFAPGEDRFEGVDMAIAPNGCPILQDALAYVECTVSQRLECGDHWLIYAIAQTGKVFNTEGLTAVHHRQSGNHY
ncbi:diflavin flavoprotein [Gloeocapsa sp. PCC 73106]|uniref:diflavin flavoprotein n=1 Tax=Gloeocapsa sp. PCC 73106 TaxID=102232 RepID=UPI0002ACEB07|nr:diflavin flavoprotein [Gloeocapsa sp. PCC 73106]ELR99121.1 putative flavoprotein [Gloeocapsa sp. PCC 73106]